MVTGQPWHSGISSETDEDPSLYPSLQDLPASMGTEVENPAVPRDQGIGPFPTSRHAAVFALGLAAAVCFVSSLALIRPFTAAMCATLTWLCWYCYWLQSERLHLMARVDVLQAEAKKIAEEPGKPVKGPSELDITTCAKAFGMDLDNTIPKDGIYNKVLTITLIKEYLRNLSELKQYRKNLGALPPGEGKPSLDLPAAILKGLGLADVPVEPPATHASSPSPQELTSAQRNQHEGRSKSPTKKACIAPVAQHDIEVACEDQSLVTPVHDEFVGPPSPDQRRRVSDSGKKASNDGGRDSSSNEPIGGYAPWRQQAECKTRGGVVPECQLPRAETSIALTPWRQQAAPLPPPSEAAGSQASSLTPWRQERPAETSTAQPPSGSQTSSLTPWRQEQPVATSTAQQRESSGAAQSELPWRRSSSSLEEVEASSQRNQNPGSSDTPWRRSSSSLGETEPSAHKTQDPTPPVHFGLFGAR